MSDLVMHSSDSDEWYTPPHILRALLNALGREQFALDPASGAEGSAIAQVTITGEENGLTSDWAALADGGPTWVNYPYSGHADWMDKITTEAQKPNCGPIFVLTKASATETKWWVRNAPQADLICRIHQRVSFGDANNGAPYPNALLVYNYPEISTVRAEDNIWQLLHLWGLCHSPTGVVRSPPRQDLPEVKGHRWSKDHHLADVKEVYDD